MTTFERDELLSLLEAIPSSRRGELLALARRLATDPPAPRPEWPDGPLSAEDAAQMRRDIEEAFEQSPDDDGTATLAARFDRLAGHGR